MTSSTRETKWNSSCSRRCSGISSTSAALSSGATMWRIPRRCAASAFSFRPPIGRTSPWRVTSPVIATSERTQRPVSSDTSAVTIVTPALGPSLGIAPAGTWTWNSVSSNASSSMPSSAAWPRT